MTLPTLTQIETLHRKYAPNDEAFNSVYTHCQIIWDIAAQLIDRNHMDIDIGLVQVGCLLHDIGVYRVEDTQHYIQHGILGEAILKEEGFPETIWRFASHHTGVGLTRENIAHQNLPLPDQDYLAETPTEELIMYADKFHSKSDPPRFNSYDFYCGYVARFGQDKLEKFTQLAEKFGIPELESLSVKYGHVLK